MSCGKRFLVIGNQNAITYREVFPLIRENKIWMGASNGMGSKFTFIVPDTYEGKFVSIVNDKRIDQVNIACWFTNLEHSKRNEEIVLYKKYNAEDYPKYDNYDAIEVSKVADIPYDYDGVMGVPITFIGHYNPEQFEIVKAGKGNDKKDLCINGKCPYFRILIKRKY